MARHPSTDVAEPRYVVGIKARDNDVHDLDRAIPVEPRSPNMILAPCA